MQSGVRIQMGQVQLNDIKQTAISDGGKNALCLGLVNLQMAAAEMGLVPDLEQIDAWVDESIRVGALRTKDGVNSDGWILPGGHEKMAAIVGLRGVRKVYVKFDVGIITARLQWKLPVELRDEGKHSLLCVGWFQDVDGKIYGECLDPWPKTDDKRIDFDRAMTQRIVNGKWVDSRSIEYIGYYQRISAQTAVSSGA